MAFCILPWIHQCVRPNGKISLCCVSREQKNFSYNELEQWKQSEFLEKIKEDFLSGRKPDICSKCWDEEDKGMSSNRTHSNDLFLPGIDIEKFKSTLKNETHTLSLDLKLGNLCNLNCIMCSPVHSSSWMTEWKKNKESLMSMGIDYTHTEHEDYSWAEKQEFWDIYANLPNLKHIKFTGGEPLINPYIIPFLNKLPNPHNISLNITTNLTKLNQEMISTFGKFKHIEFNVSLEGIGEVNDYVRFGSSWNELYQNIMALKDEGFTIIVNHVLQALTVPHINEIIAFCDENDLPLNIILLQNPSYLAAEVLPPDVINATYENITKDIGNIKQILQSIQHDPKRIPTLIKYLNIMDQNRGTTKGSEFINKYLR